MVALSSGGVSVTTRAEEEFVKHERNAAFVRAVGGMYLQVTDQLPKDRPATAADRRILGERMTEIGKRSADLGVGLGYHNHMNSLGERPGEVDDILAAADSRYVRLELTWPTTPRGRRSGEGHRSLPRSPAFPSSQGRGAGAARGGVDPARSYRWVGFSGRGRAL
jgi:hypothetical protein